ncbi:hypothetical protein F2P56_034078, partial [Juglans regia]
MKFLEAAWQKGNHLSQTSSADKYPVLRPLGFLDFDCDRTCWQNYSRRWSSKHVSRKTHLCPIYLYYLNSSIPDLQSTEALQRSLGESSSICIRVILAYVINPRKLHKKHNAMPLRFDY